MHDNNFKRGVSFAPLKKNLLVERIFLEGFHMATKPTAQHTENLKKLLSGETLSATTLRALDRLGLIDANNKITPAGQAELDKTAVYIEVQTVELVDGKRQTAWQRVKGEDGKILKFATSQTAEAVASRLSVQNGIPHRVIGGKGIIIYDFGTRSIVQNGSTSLVLDDLPMTDNDADDVIFYSIEKRLSHIYNDGRFSEWERVGEYPDLTICEDEVSRLSAKDTTNEYRIALADTPPAPVIRLGNQTYPDVSMLQSLIDAMRHTDDNSALAYIIKLWANRNPDTLKDIAKWLIEDDA